MFKIFLIIINNAEFFFSKVIFEVLRKLIWAQVI